MATLRTVTHAECVAFACPADKKQVRLTVGNGLYLEARATGGKYWFLKFRAGGAEKRLALGVFPEVMLKEAKAKRDDARSMIRNGIDPTAERRAAKLRAKVAAETAFEAVAREWHKLKSSEWVEKTASIALSRLERLVFPYIGHRPVAEITPPEILALIRRIEADDKVETAHRIKQLIGEVIRHGIRTGRASTDPTRDLAGALKSVNVKHHPAIIEPAQLRPFLLAVDAYSGSGPVVRSYLKLALLTFQRPGELRRAKWGEFDLDNRLWTVPAERMKRTRAGKTSGEDHLVPLSAQAVDVLRDLLPITGHREFVFAAPRGGKRPISDMASGQALDAMGYKDVQTVHGFRATARTILEERLGYRHEVIEPHLAHVVRDTHGRAYNRTKHLTERGKMIQAWADFLDSLRASTNVVPLFKQA